MQSRTKTVRKISTEHAAATKSQRTRTSVRSLPEASLKAVSIPLSLHAVEAVRDLQGVRWPRRAPKAVSDLGESAGQANVRLFLNEQLHCDYEKRVRRKNRLIPLRLLLLLVGASCFLLLNIV